MELSVAQTQKKIVRLELEVERLFTSPVRHPRSAGAVRMSHWNR
jgi:hypothetical protein